MAAQVNTYAGTADAMTRAALQAVVALPADLKQFNNTSSATNADNMMTASSTTDLTRANLTAQAIYTNANLVATVNDGLNANQYITSLINSEQTRVNVANNTVRNEQYKLRTKLLSYEYLLNYYRTGTSVVILTLYVVLVTLVVAAMWRGGAMQLAPFLILIGLLLEFYAVVVILAAAQVSSRREGSWSQRVFKVKGQNSINAAYKPQYQS